ncbi:MAG: ABC transporter substrate binding protein, partial [Desulfopila sp.]|nr:ABC transporter substrate binding protein [Desulfopila sp.]
MSSFWTISTKKQLQVLFFVLILACLFPGAVSSNTSIPQILIIHSYHPGFSWTDRINSGMTKTLHNAIPDADIHIEYLDAKRYKTELIMPAFRELLFRKYQETPLDAIIVSDDAAFESILSLKDSLFPAVPLVFCGVNAFEKKMIDEFTDVTGVIEDFDLAGTLDLALSLHPDTRHLAVISDSTATGRLNLERFRHIKPAYNDRFASIVEFAELSEKELRRGLSGLQKKDTIILLLSFYRDRNGKAFSVLEMTDLIAQSARLPVYSAWDFVLGNKVVGGLVVSGRQQGQVAAELAVKILNGEPAGEIPVVQVSPNLFLFDDKELSYFDIDRDKLPEDSVIINQQTSPLQKYFWLIAGLVTFAIVETFLVLALLEKSRRYKIAEEELRRSKERFTLAMQAATDGIFDWNLETNDIYYSPAWKQMLGYREDELENRFSEWERLTAPEDVKLSWQVMQEHLDGKRERFEVEFKMRHKDGHWIDVLARASAVFDAAGKAVRVVGTHVDITARKQAEKALRESEERFRTLYMNTPAMMHSIDSQGRLIAVSTRWLEKMEYDVDEVLGRKSIDFLTETSRRYATEEALPHFFQTGIASNVEYQMVSKSGRILDILMSAISERDEHGRVIRSMAVLEDITERKLAEDALRKSEANLREAQAIARMGRWELDLISNTLFWSNGTFTLCEINQEDFTPSYEAFMELVHPDDRAEVNRAYQLSVSNKTPYEIEHRLLMPDGRIKWVAEIGRTEYEADGTPLRSIGAVQDISERKEAEKALVERETLFRGMFEEHSAVMLLIDPETGTIIKANQAAADYYGYPLEKMLQMQIQQLNTSSPEETEKNISQALQKQRNTFGFRHVLADGRIRDVEVHSAPITIQDRPMLFSIIHDVTERKQAEDALRKSEEKYRYMFENIQDAVYATSLEGEILDISPSIKELSRGQFTREELIGKSVYDFYP